MTGGLGWLGNMTRKIRISTKIAWLGNRKNRLTERVARSGKQSG